jgi:hypothetical protein
VIDKTSSATFLGRKDPQKQRTIQLKLEELKRGGITLRGARRVPVLFLVSYGTARIFHYCYENADLVHVVPLFVKPQGLMRRDRKNCMIRRKQLTTIIGRSAC